MRRTAYPFAVIPSGNLHLLLLLSFPQGICVCPFCCPSRRESAFAPLAVIPAGNLRFLRPGKLASPREGRGNAGLLALALAIPAPRIREHPACRTHQRQQSRRISGEFTHPLVPPLEPPPGVSTTPPCASAAPEHSRKTATRATIPALFIRSSGVEVAVERIPAP